MSEEICIATDRTCPLIINQYSCRTELMLLHAGNIAFVLAVSVLQIIEAMISFTLINATNRGIHSCAP